MRYWVALTDADWHHQLAALPDLEEVNFWQPTATRRPVLLEPGAPVLFKLHAPHGGWIVGCGFFVEYIVLPVSLAWEMFGVSNGAATLPEMVGRVSGYRHRPTDVTAFDIGCSVLSAPIFFRRSDWIPPPHDWKPNIVQGKSYDSETAEGARLWAEVQRRLAAVPTDSIPVHQDRYGRAQLVRPDLARADSAPWLRRNTNAVVS
jgi:putative restriction endonuclease